MNNFKLIIVMMIFLLLFTTSKDVQGKKLSTHLNVKCATGDLIAFVTILNDSGKNIMLHTAQIGGDGYVYSKSLFSVKHVETSQPIQYQGRQGSLNFEKESYIELKSGDRLNLLLNLSKFYDLYPYEKYRIKYKALSTDFHEPELQHELNSNEIEVSCN